jgi:hypothetical protein
VLAVGQGDRHAVRRDELRCMLGGGYHAYNCCTAHVHNR